MNIRFRRAQKQDSEFAYQTKKTVLKTYVDQIWGWIEEEQRRYHERRFSKNDVYIIELDTIDIGIMTIGYEPDCLNIYQLFILPTYQRKGIGTYCMEQIHNKASKRHIPVRLRTFKINNPAIAFYTKLGYKKTDKTETHFIFEKIV